jgi:hypothetical protein
MSKLKIIQDQFIDSLYQEDDTSILNEIKDGHAPKSELLKIYRNNLNSALTNSLRITYPHIYQLLGDKKFQQYTNKFITQSRSFSGNLDDYGHNFAEFFKNQKEDFFSDLASFEWLKQSSYLAANAENLDASRLQTLSIDQLPKIKFQLDPSCFLYQSNYNLLSSKKANKPNIRPKYFLITRSSLEVYSMSISQTDFNFLQAIKDGTTLSDMHDNKIRNIQNCLSKYIANQIICNFIVLL